MPTAKATLLKKAERDWLLISQNCQKAIEAAAQYLVNTSRPNDAGWSDFPTNRSGESTSWVTGHVLSQAGPLLPPRLSESSLKALLNKRNENGGWGFSEFVPPDCDSTLHVLWAILTLHAK